MHPSNNQLSPTTSITYRQRIPTGTQCPRCEDGRSRESYRLFGIFGCKLSELDEARSSAVVFGHELCNCRLYQEPHELFGPPTRLVEASLISCQRSAVVDDNRHVGKLCNVGVYDIPKQVGRYSKVKRPVQAGEGVHGFTSTFKRKIKKRQTVA